jgi:hypothetical protein
VDVGDPFDFVDVVEVAHIDESIATAATEPTIELEPAIESAPAIDFQSAIGLEPTIEVDPEPTAGHAPKLEPELVAVERVPTVAPENGPAETAGLAVPNDGAIVASVAKPAEKPAAQGWWKRLTRRG